MSKSEWDLANEQRKQIDEELKSAKSTIKRLEEQLKYAEDHCVKYEKQISELEEDVEIFKKASKDLANKNKEDSVTIKELKQAIKTISKHLE